MKCSLGISSFLEQISSLSHSIVFSSICLHWSLRKAFLSLLAILWNSAFRWVYLSFSPLPFSSVQFSCSVMSDSLRPCELQHARPPCPSPTPEFTQTQGASLLSSAICKASSDTILPFYVSFSWGWFWPLSLVKCHSPPSIVLQALCLSDLILWIYLSFPLYNCKGFDLDHTWMV